VTFAYFAPLRETGLSIHGMIHSFSRACLFSTLDFRPAAQSRLLATGRLLGLAKLKGRSLNVYESKGPLWKTWEQSLNITERKGVRR
jgi:hypothetical protein